MDTFYIIPHTHFDAEVFLTREEYLNWGFTNIIDVLSVLQKQPDYRFVLDQVCYIQPFIERFPELKDEFLRFVREGRLEIVCGMYAMSDVNIPSGESLARQFLIGISYCRDVLGVDVKTGWTIDSFGHHPQFAQILRKAGMDYTVFSRGGDSDRSEFIWRGLDGSAVLAHWTPMHYDVMANAPGYPHGYRDYVEQRFQQLRAYTDGGAVMGLEGSDLNPPNAATLALAAQYNTLPDRICNLKVALPSEFFADAEARRESLPVISKDFNPIFQGCYSARIGIKQLNRKAETLLYSTEFMDSLARVRQPKCPAVSLRDAWELVLFNQFHDDICGVIVDKVENLVTDRYRQAIHDCERQLGERLALLGGLVKTEGAGLSVMVVNTLAWARRDVARMDLAFAETDAFGVVIRDGGGAELPFELEDIKRHANGAIKRATAVFTIEVPAAGYTVCYAEGCAAPYRPTAGSGGHARIENDFYTLDFDEWNGAVVSIRDKKTDAEYVDPRSPWLNTLWREDDQGDFWEIGAPLKAYSARPYHRAKPLSEGANPACSKDWGGVVYTRKGAVRESLFFRQTIAQHSFETCVTLYRDLPRIDIQSKLTNRQKNVRYRIAFPTAVTQGVITREIPFGSLQSGEGEYPAQNWLDYSEDGKGLGLINCGLPGNAVFGDMMLLSVLKSTAYVAYGDVGGFDSGTKADGGFEMGVPHVYDYALLPHGGDWKAVGLHKAAAERNHPLLTQKCGQGAAEEGAYSLFTLSDENVMVSCVKAEGKTLVLRLFDECGAESPALTLQFSVPVASAEETNLVEDSRLAQPLTVCGDAISFDLKAFEVKTLRVVLA